LSEYLIGISSFDLTDFFDDFFDDDFFGAALEVVGMMLAFTKNKQLTALYQMELLW